MAEMVLPGVYINVRAEGLMVPGPVSVGNLGIVGTSSKGPIGEPVVLGSYLEAREKFGDYDPWINGASGELTLVRALEIAFANGATTAIAVRVTGKTNEGKTSAKSSSYKLVSASGDCVNLSAKSEGTWGNALSVSIGMAEEHAFVTEESVPTSGADLGLLKHHPVIKSARNRIVYFNDATGVAQSLQILYDGDPVPISGQVRVDRASGQTAFGDAVAPADKVIASYLVDKSSAVKATIKLGTAEEVYTVVSGANLVSEVMRLSAWLNAEKLANSGELPNESTPAGYFGAFKGGDNGAAGSNYKDGLDRLLNEPAHIIIAAGQDASFGDELDAHCQQASTDSIKRDRIAVVGSKSGIKIDDLRGNNLDSDRLIFVAPGIKVNDNAANPPVEVTLPGAYAAAAVAGMLADFSAHISPTNKTLRIGGLEQRFTSAELSQLVLSRVLALEERQGFRIVKGITTSTNTAWQQITTRRIVDYAKFGVRSAANPFIGLLNNERVRGTLRTAINSFLADMVIEEMLYSYTLEVIATPDEERKGVVRVTIVMRPVFSIDYIKVTMFLE